MIKRAIVILTILILSLIIPSSTLAQSRYWEIQSIDTMKFSRDLARQKLKDPAFDITIDTQVRLIADSGVTHIAIATPYDEEFLPYLRKWVNGKYSYAHKWQMTLHASQCTVSTLKHVICEI